MKIYTIYTKPTDPNSLENAVLVKEGFSIFAALLHFFWAFYHRMWFTGFVLFAINFLITYMGLHGLSADIIDILKIGLLAFVGFGFNDWYRTSLLRRGYVESGIVSGKNSDEAHYKFLCGMLQRSSVVSGKPLADAIY